MAEIADLYLIVRPGPCDRCHQESTHIAHRNGNVVRMCGAHHRHVWRDLAADGWTVVPL